MKKPTKSEKQNLQKLYLACRGLLTAGVGTPICVQKSFEEMLYGYLGEDSWRPTHITYKAALEGLNGTVRNLQRAHGIIEGRLDRYDRTMKILGGDEKSFDEWWQFYVENDATVILTRKEHGAGTRFTRSELIEVPASKNLFGSRGFSFKFRKKNEVAWLSEVVGAMNHGPRSSG